jgi:murein DD-endopeptidase MepM/ murein hydrolase activator NlpD
MLRILAVILFFTFLSPKTSSASLCDQWNSLEREIRDSMIGRKEAKERIIRLDMELIEKYRDVAEGTDYRFPVKGYGAKSIGGENGDGYKASGYDFYDGNRHGGHPAHDIFIRDKRGSGLDDATGKPAEVRAFTGGVVVAVNPAWRYPGKIRGGIYIWIFNPAENRFYYYAHLQKALVSTGDRVKGGDAIALLGRTGKNAWRKRSPTHLHFMCLSFDGGKMTPVNTYRELLSAKVDGFAKSPSAVLRSSFVTAAYLYVRLIPQLSQALHLELFALPSHRREFASASRLNGPRIHDGST